MFSGIVERVGSVESIERGGSGEARIRVRAAFPSPPSPGASVAVNGVCLTVESEAEGVTRFTAVPETLRRTTLGGLRPGARVNLERALRVGDEIGGHWVQGHVDAIARVDQVRRAGADRLVRLIVPEPLRRYVALKGSLTLDGVSLTVASWEEPRATVALVPYTLEHTIASDYEEGSDVNLEVDLLARYLERLAQSRGLLAPHAPLAPEGT